MAGPGGGPSRRSHTKSRKGCKTCKRRHIRCDETFPQCRNCTKHQVRCDYMDGPQASSSGDDTPSGAQQPHLLWTPEIEKAIDAWQQTEEFPFPDLQLYPQPQWSKLSRVDLRLLYNVAQICSDSARERTSKVLVWTELMPKFLCAAATHTFVMHGVLSFSANHLAWTSQSSEVREIAMNHRAAALRGLHEAIGTFSQANADAVLAGSLLLSWQATDWRNWASLMTGISSITQAMQAWRDQSIFCDYLVEHASDPPRIYSEVGEMQPSPERVQECLMALQGLHNALDQLHHNLPEMEQGHRWIEQLKGYVRRLQSSSPPQTQEEQFSQLYALRKWIFWVPVSLLATQKGDILTLLVLAYFYAAAIAVEPIFPDLGAEFVANQALRSLSEVAGIVGGFQQSQGYSHGGQQMAALMQFPSETATRYRSRRDWARQSMGLPTVQQPPYGLEALNLDLTAQLSDQGYYHNLSPAFAPSPLHLASPAILSPTSAAQQRSPYLEVPPRTPHSALDATAALGYLSGGSIYSTPISTPLASPMSAPAGFGGQLMAAAAAPQQQHDDQAFMAGVGGTWHGGPTPHLLQHQHQQQHQQHHQHPQQHQHHGHQPHQQRQAYQHAQMAPGVLRSNSESDDRKGKATEGPGWTPSHAAG